MKHRASWILLIGDLVMIVLYLYYNIFDLEPVGSYVPDQVKLLVFLVSVLPFMAVWLATAGLLRSFDGARNFGPYMLLTLAAWSVTVILALLIRAGLMAAVFRLTYAKPVLAPITFVLAWLVGFVYLGGWRMTFKLLQRFLRRPMPAGSGSIKSR